MPRLSSIHRIVLGLVSLTVSILLVAGLIGLVPNPEPLEQQARRSFCESTAVSFMALASRMDSEQLQKTLDRIRSRNTHVESIGIRKADGELVLQSGGHRSQWQSDQNSPSTAQETAVPISANGEHWGRVEVRWHPGVSLSILGVPIRPDLLLSVIVALMSFVVFSLYLGKVYWGNVLR